MIENIIVHTDNGELRCTDLLKQADKRIASRIHLMENNVVVLPFGRSRKIGFERRIEKFRGFCFEDRRKFLCAVINDMDRVGAFRQNHEPCGSAQDAHSAVAAADDQKVVMITELSDRKKRNHPVKQFDCFRVVFIDVADPDIGIIRRKPLINILDHFKLGMLQKGPDRCGIGLSFLLSFAISFEVFRRVFPVSLYSS